MSYTFNPFTGNFDYYQSGSSGITFPDLATPPASTALGSSGAKYTDLFLSGQLVGTNFALRISPNVGIGDTGIFAAITSGTGNIAIGSGGVLSAVTSGANNVAIGDTALGALTTAVDNVAVGPLALSTLTTGLQNTAIGSQALQFLTTGSNNTSIGASTNIFLTSGEDNIAIGRNAGYSTSGSFNILVGTYAGNGNGDMIGSDNILIGHEAGQQNIISGTNNVGVGYRALERVQASSNVGIGANACSTVTTGTNNTCIGTDADVASASTSNTMVFGNSSVTDAYFGSTSAAAKIHAANASVFGGFALTLSGNLTTTGAFNPTFAIPSSSTWTFPSGGGTLSTTTGTVTSIATTSPISGGTITTTGTISLLVNTNFNWTAGQTITAPAGSTALTLAGGTQISNFPALDIAQTWNASGTTFTAFKVNVTNTASGVASLLVDIQRDSGFMFKIDKVGGVYSNDGFYGPGFIANSTTGSIAFGSGFGDVKIVRDGAANTLGLRNGTSAQILNIYNTFTSSTSFERLMLDWATTANVAMIYTQKGSGGGTARVLQFNYGGTTTAAISIPITSGPSTYDYPKFTTGVSNDGSGFKHARVTTGSVAGASTALVDITWGTAFADTNYTAVVQVLEATASSLSMSVVHIETISTTKIQVRVINNAAGSLTGTLHAVAIHD